MAINPTIRIAAIVTVTVGVVMAVGGVYLLGEARHNETVKLERSVRQAWTMGRAGMGGSTLEDLVAVARRLIEKTPVTGGVVRDSVFKEVARFGEVSEVSREAPTLRERLFGRLHHDLVIHDAAHDITLVVDADDRYSTLQRAVASVSGLALVIAGLLGSLAAWVGEAWFSRPQRIIAELLASPDPIAAEEVEQRYGGDTTLGRLAAAAAGLSRRYLELADAKLRRAQALVEHYPHPILIFSKEGELAEANRSALRVFSAEDLPGLFGRRPLARIRLDDGTPLKNALANGAHLGLATVRTPRGDLPCLLACDRLHDPEGGPDRQVVTFVDMRTASPDIGAGGGDVRTGRLTANLEACRILLQAMDQDEEDDDEIPVELAALVEGWREKSAERGLIGDFYCSRLPVVAGNQLNLEHILSSALHTVRGRSLLLQPSISVTGRIEDGGVAITVEEDNEPPVAAGADVSIPMAALIKLLAREGGRLVSASATGEPNRLSFHLEATPMPDEMLISSAA